MAAYKHGVYVSEQVTSLTAPVEGTAGLQVIVGTAPVYQLDDPSTAVNTPILVHNYAEAVQAVGYSDDFTTFTLCEAISANFQVIGAAPIVLINVLNPEIHNSDFAEVTLPLTDGKATLQVKNVVPSTLKVTESDTRLTAGTDYTTSLNEDGYLDIVVINRAAAVNIVVSGKVIDASAVTADDIIGSVDTETGKETGLEVLRQVYPKLGLVPGIIVVPGWSKKPAVAAAMQAKTVSLNGVFKCVCIIDVDSSATGAKKYQDVTTQKTAQAISSPNAYAVWPCAKIGDVIYNGSSLAAALTARNDADNGDIPNVSPSNVAISISAACLEDGTEVILDIEQANTVNSYGVATFLNMNGFRLWGVETAAYPGTTDPKDRDFAVRRFMTWAANTFILTYFQKVDKPANKRLIESIVDSENIRGNSFVARGLCARYEMTFDESENPVTNLMNGTIVFHQYITPYLPARDIENIIEFDPDALSAVFG